MSASPRPLPQNTAGPAILTALLGRDAELDQVLALLDAPSARLVTITGPGGVGKTRLALHVANTLIAEFNRDVVFVPLAAVHDPSLVLPTIGQALGVTFDTTDTNQDRVIETLRDRNPLLVLDNFEQLLSAAPVVANLLARFPDTTILVTSQAPLGIDGEQLFPLAPLPTPAKGDTTTGAILQSHAVALFIARALAVKPNLVVDDHAATTIAEICRHLDGLPLAIELAAARVNILSLDALLARLSNRLHVLGGERPGVPERLLTMRNAIAWSYDLLTADEQTLLRRLSVFAGGSSLEAVEAMACAAGSHRAAFDILSALVDHSLLQVVALPMGGMRYLMLGTLRDYGLEQLEAHGELDEARLAHAQYFLDLAREAEPFLTGATQQAWLERLDQEWENLRTALAYATEHGHEPIALGIIGAIWRFCGTRGHATESGAFLQRALAAAASTVDSTMLLRALIGGGHLAEDLRQLDEANAYFHQANALAKRIHDPRLEQQSLIGLGTVAHDRGNYDDALTWHRQAEVLAREIDNPRAIAIALGNVAAVSYFQGNLAEAERAWEEGRIILRDIGDAESESLAVSNLGALAMDRGEFEHARELLERALALQRQTNNRRDVSFTLSNLGDVWFHLGDYTLADDMFREAIQIFGDYGDINTQAITLTSSARLALARGDAARAAAVLLESVSTLATTEDRFSQVRNAELLATICSERKDFGTAAELLAAAAAIRDDLGSKPNAIEIAEIEATLEAARNALGPQRVAQYREAGSTLGFESLSRRMMIVAREIAGTPSPTPPAAPVTLPPIQHNLTAREMDVLRHLAEGLSTKEISDILSISPRTTTTHVENILGKLEATSRTAAVAYALRAGLV